MVWKEENQVRNRRPQQFTPHAAAHTSRWVKLPVKKRSEITTTVSQHVIKCTSVLFPSRFYTNISRALKTKNNVTRVNSLDAKSDEGANWGKVKHSLKAS
ncbi:hypothetical protein TRVL_07695 [Trypanosoma vivax]|nr:hypothetical protein TRVL_07695 [Trypanosoma vivax]